MQWILDKDFLGLSPFRLSHKEKEELVIPEHPPELQNRHMLVRKRFVCANIRQAELLITADDYYKVWLNGHWIGQGPAPSTAEHYYYNSYDITALLREGENVLAVHVYYQGLINRVWNSGDLRMGMLARISADGNVLCETDASWLCSRAREYVGSATVGYKTQFAEDIDNRLKQTGWKNLDFDDSAWEPACVHPQPDYTFLMQPTLPLQVYPVSPCSVRELARGNYLLDFGQERTGSLLLRAGGKAGDTVELHFGEELAQEDEVRSVMRCNCVYQETWTLADGENELEQYDYKAFRYVQLLTDAAEIDTASIRALVRHYPFDDTSCRMESADPMLNKVWAICKNAVKYGTQEGYLDCPSREKGQYLGDATVTALSHAYLTGELAMYQKCLTDFARSAAICPGLMATAPGSFMQEIADYSLQWPAQLMQYYDLSGDLHFLREMLATAQGILAYFARWARADGLLEDYNDKPIMVDWPSNLRDGYDSALMPDYQPGCNTVLNAFYIGAVQAVARMEKQLGVAGDRGLPALQQAFVKAFYREKTGLFVDTAQSGHSSLHANALPLYFGLVPGGNTAIVPFIQSKRLCCGVYFSYFVLKALCAAGEHAFVLQLLTGEDSWGNMVREGATTCFEAWGKEQKWNTSLCHPWASSPVIILVEEFAGIRFSDGVAAIQPCLPEGLEGFQLQMRFLGRDMKCNSVCRH